MELPPPGPACGGNRSPRGTSTCSPGSFPRVTSNRHHSLNQTLHLLLTLLRPQVSRLSRRQTIFPAPILASFSLSAIPFIWPISQSRCLHLQIHLESTAAFLLLPPQLEHVLSPGLLWTPPTSGATAEPAVSLSSPECQSGHGMPHQSPPRAL